MEKSLGKSELQKGEQDTRQHVLQNYDEYHYATATFAETVHGKLHFVSFGPYLSWAFGKHDQWMDRANDQWIYRSVTVAPNRLF